MSTTCPCHSGKLYQECCEPYHKGELPPTALALMRSRYAAYALGLTSYILATGTQKSSPSEIEEFSKKTKFIGLKILDVQETSVTFTAILSQEGHDVSFTEKSHFVKQNGKWVYVRGNIPLSSEG